MKRRILLVMVTLTMVVFAYLQFGREPTISSSIETSFINGSEMNLTVIANKLYISDQEAYAQKLLDRYIQNDFAEVDFCPEEKGYCNGLHITVYYNSLARKQHKKAFEVDYIQKDGDLFQYDVSQSKHFTMKIR